MFRMSPLRGDLNAKREADLRQEKNWAFDARLAADAVAWSIWQ
jgi:hypothetical protein